jgi:hypothetical protein
MSGVPSLAGLHVKYLFRATRDYREGRRAQYYLYRVTREADSWSVEVMVRAYQPHRDRFCLAHEHHLSVPVMASTSF